jgi:diaminopimelate epimerase
MELHFYKYHGAGNDFILLDNRDGEIALTNEQVAFLCNRHFGIGADGLMLLETAEGYDFQMVYYNSDGNESSMCGNGGRCITAFAKQLGLITDKARFVAIDGPHDASYNTDGNISLHMQHVEGIEHFEGYSILNTGSPHYVKWVRDVKATNVFDEGRAIRNEDRFRPKGINVNFVQKVDDGLWIRTYERGVEDETLSCGTGVTAGAIAATCNLTGNFSTRIFTPGGELNVSFTKDSISTAKDVILTGPAVLVFEGRIKI